jgi:hypothetical protein
MPLTVEAIRNARSDQDLFSLLSEALQQQIPDEVDNESLLRIIQGLSPGLRAMAAIYQLDVSMALDDLGWHFANWYSQGLARETLLGLRELGATEAAEVFEAAFRVAMDYWDHIGSDDFQEWYDNSPLEKAMEPLNARLFDICKRSKELGLMSYWLEYARKFPERVVGGPPAA